MDQNDPNTVRILAVDDERPILDAYRQILANTEAAAPDDELSALRAKLFDDEPPHSAAGKRLEFDLTCCSQAEDGVAAVAASVAQGQPFALVLLDMRMPPGRDGAWAAQRIREIDPNVDIVIVTAYSDIDPRQLSSDIPPPEHIYYVQKPFHPHEIAQFATALGTRWQAGRALVEQEKQNARLGRLVDSSSNEIYVFDLKTKRCLLSNATARNKLGYSAEELQALTLMEFNESMTGRRLDEIIRPLIHGTGDTASYRSIQFRRDGTKYPVAGSIHISRDEEPPVAVAVIKDISAEQRAERQLYELAYYDTVTGLPNRRNFIEHCKRSIAVAERNKSLMATLFIDLNDFKRVNDSLGHSFGDLLLKRVGERLNACLRSSDIVAAAGRDFDFSVARLGGDEYTILLNPIQSSAEATAVAERIISELNKPDEINGHELVVTPSVGIAIYPLDGKTVDELLESADTAMYQAKSGGSSNYEYFSQTMSRKAAQRLSLDMKLRRCVEREELLLHYQPQIDFVSGEILGVEALVRWNNPDIGLVAPMDFIPLAEENGTITEIGEWVLRAGCRQLREWQGQGFAALRMSLNVSPIQFRYSGLANTIAAAGEASDIDPAWLEIEITETTVMQSADTSAVTLNELAGIGVSVAIDDFGIGYSSLSYLQQYPIDVLKIDRSFICDLERNADSQAIVRAIVAMAKSLNMQIVAEGVESAEQFGLLAQYQIDRAQGYLIARPLSAEAMTQLLEAHDPCFLQKSVRQLDSPVMSSA